MMKMEKNAASMQEKCDCLIFQRFPNERLLGRLAAAQLAIDLAPCTRSVSSGDA